METLTLLRFWKQQCCSQWSWLTTVLGYQSHWINLRCVERHFCQNRKVEFVRHFRKQQKKSSLSVGPPLAAASAGVHQHREQMAELQPKPVIIRQNYSRWWCAQLSLGLCGRESAHSCPITSALSGVLSQQFCSWGQQAYRSHFLCKCYNFHLSSACFLMELSLPKDGFSG